MSKLGKFTRPRPAGALPRERLFRVVDGGRRHPVIWITGAPGAGKTTLASTYVESRRLPCLWYRMQEEDGDAASFFHYFGIAVQGSFPARRTMSLPHLTSEYAGNIAAFARRYFEQAYRHLKRPAVIVLDNYERVSPGAPLHEVVRNLVESLPEGVNLLTLSRVEPPAAFASLRANGVVALVGGEELELTAGEVGEIVALRGRELDESALRRLRERSQGWAAGVVLALERKCDPGMRPPEAATPQVIFDYFAGEIFDRARPEVQATLARASLLAGLPAPRVAQLTGIAEGERILAEFARNNYFTVRLVGAKGAPALYQFHPLFREFLLRRLEEMVAPAELKRLRREAAALLEADGEIAEAVAHLVGAEAWDEILRVTLARAKEMVAQGRGKVVEDWLLALPAPLRDSTPWALHWLGMCRLASDPAEARDHLERAYRLFVAAGDRAGLLSTWACVIETFVYEWGQFRAVDHWIALLDELLAGGPAFPSADIESRVAAAMFSALMYRQPQRPDLPQWAERVHRLVLASPRIETQMLLGNQLVLFYTFCIGDAAKAEVLFEAVRPPRNLESTSPIAYIAWRCVEAAYQVALGAPEKCLAAVESGLEAEERHGVAVRSFFLVSHGVIAKLNIGDFPEAAKLLDRGRTALNPARLLDRAHYHFLRFLYACHIDDASSAAENARHAVELADDAGVPFSQAYYRLALAHALFEHGRRRAALAELAAARRIGRALRSKNLEFSAAFSVVYFALESGKSRLAAPLLRRTMALSKLSGFANRLLWTPRNLTRVLIAALENGIETEYVRTLIRKRRLSPVPEVWHTESWPFPVMVYTLGRFAVLVDGKPLEFRGKGQRKPLELLMALVAFGGREVSERRITEALWPDAEGDASHEACAVALHRLRRLLCCEYAVTLKRSHLSLDPRYVWTDVWAFERSAAAGATAFPKPSDDGHHAASLYRGQFLGGYLDLPWTIATRERLRSKFIRHLAERGRGLCAAGHFGAAIAAYERGLEVDALAEEFYQGLMRCHSALGRRADVIAVYRRCERVLSASLGLAPSAKTASLCQSLHRAGASFT